VRRFFLWRPRKTATGGDAIRRIAESLDRLGHLELADEVTFYANTAEDTAIRVTVFGEYSVGKSTLINALIGRSVLAARLKPTTGVPTEVRHGTDRVEIVFRDGHIEIATLTEAMDIIDIGVENRARDAVERVIITTEGGVLRPGLTLIDTPGVLDEDMQTERAKREIAAADIVMLVLRADHMLSRTERALSLGLLTRELGKPVVPVINWLGQTDPGEHDDLRDILANVSRGLIQPFAKPWYEVDALPALRHRLGIEGAAPPQDDYGLLLQEIGDLAADAGSRIRRKVESRARWRASWRRRAQEANDAIMQRLREEADALAAERRLWAENLKASLHRLDTDRAGQKSRALNFLDQHKTGGVRALGKRLPAAADMKTDEQRKAAFAKAGRALERALAEIDDNANAILSELGRAGEIVLEPLSVRELAALEIPAEDAIEAAKDGAGGIGLFLLGGAALLAGGWIVAIPAAIIGWLIGRTMAGDSKEIEDFRAQIAANMDAQLEKLRPLLASQFEARADELRTALEARLNAVSTVPPRKDEMKLREDLAALLQSL
jgi:hypothetical protein